MTVLARDGGKIIVCGFGRNPVRRKNTSDILYPTPLTGSGRVTLEFLRVAIVAGIASSLSLGRVLTIATMTIPWAHVELIRVCVMKQNMTTAKVAPGELLRAVTTQEWFLFSIFSSSSNHRQQDQPQKFVKAAQGVPPPTQSLCGRDGSWSLRLGFRDA